MSASEVYQYTAASGSGQVAAKELQGVFCSSSSTLVMSFFDGTVAAGAPLVAQFTLTAGQFYRLPFRLQSNLLGWSVVSGTGTFTIAYN